MLAAGQRLLPEHASFADWTVVLAALPSSPQPLLWSAEDTFSVHRFDNGDYLLRFPGIAEFKIEFVTKRIAAFAWSPAPAETLRHLLHDQVAPRLLANTGQLVLHAGAVETSQGALIVSGLSGEGKSTLLASFDAHGCPLIGDDSIHVRMQGPAATACSLYRSLRLFPDSIDHVLGGGHDWTAVAHYTEKRNITALETRRRMPGYVPVRAIYFLGPGSPRVSCRRITPSQACMSALEHSFWLDPFDLENTRARLGQAAEFAGKVPAFMLDYPRRYDTLASVREAMLQALHGGMSPKRGVV